MIPEKRLWQAVLFQAVRDATSQHDSREKREADAWIRSGRKDFREVCSLAGMEPEFIQEAYIGGKINPELLRSSTAT